MLKKLVQLITGQSDDSSSTASKSTPTPQASPTPRKKAKATPKTGEKPPRKPKKRDRALDLLISSLLTDLRQNDLHISPDNFLPEFSSSMAPKLPVFSLVFHSDEKYFVSDSLALSIKGNECVPVDEIPSTTEMCDKVRKVAQEIDEKGKYLYNEDYKEPIRDKVHYKKMMVIDDGEFFYYLVFTNVNEKFSDTYLLDESVDVLRIKVFSDNGYMCFTDTGLQGYPTYFYAKGAHGEDIEINPDDPTINEVFEKALDVFLNESSGKNEMEIKKIEKLIEIVR